MKYVAGSGETAAAAALTPPVTEHLSGAVPRRLSRVATVRHSDELRHDSHVLAGLDETRVLRVWDLVLSLLQEKTHQEDEGRSVRAGGCGQRLSAVQVRQVICLSPRVGVRPL